MTSACIFPSRRTRAERKTRWRRVAAALLLAVMAAPGLWWRDPPRRVVRLDSLTAIRLPIEASDLRTPGLALLGAWQLTSPDSEFGGYSALVPLPDGRFLGFSDTGHVLALGDPQRQVAPVHFEPIEGVGEGKASVDIEAATRDPATGTVWIALEGRNEIRRSADLAEGWDTVRPKAMREWPSNQGPETMVRLNDGRFLILSESRASFGASAGPALLFPGDPLKGGKPLRFRFAPPDGFRPTDAAVLPDGRVLILLRKLDLSLPPGFSSRLILADPATIRPGETWEWKPVAQIDRPLPRDNYEGLAVTPSQTDGSVVVWLISDDNGSIFQRTLLLKFRWRVPSPERFRTGEISRRPGSHGK